MGRTFSSHQIRLAMALVLLVALLLRLAAITPASMHHPDEVFQYLEPAHRWVFEYGIQTWEFRYNMRGWLMPAMLAGPMALGDAVDPGGGLYLLLPRLAAMLLTLLIPLGAYGIGARLSPRHGMAAAAVMAVWAETVFFSTHTLSEIQAMALAMPGIGLIVSASGDRVARRFFLGSLLIGLGVALRFHYAPALAVFLVMESRLDWRGRWLPAIAGGLAGLALAGSADVMAGHVPFDWVLQNFQQNIGNARAAQFGVTPVWQYALMMGGYWLWAGPVIALCLLPVLRPYRSIIAAAAVNFILLSLIGHKEYRFLLLTTTLCVAVAAAGSLVWLDRWLPARWSERGRMLAAIGGWALLSASLAIGPFMAQRWTDDGPALLAARDAGRLPQLCGLAMHRLKFWQAGGYTNVHRDVPIYLTRWSDEEFMDAGQVAASSAAWNAAIGSPADHVSLPASYRQVDCHGAGDERICLYLRAGGCDPAVTPDWELQRIMQAHDY